MMYVEAMDATSNIVDLIVAEIVTLIEKQDNEVY
jgi:hypothetical protein